MASKNVVAIDLGASNGRVVLGRFNGRDLTLEEVHRFGNGPIQSADGLFWDAPRLFKEMLAGIGKAAAAADGQLASVGVDTWGVDYGLLGRDGELVTLPLHYRDTRTQGWPGRVAQVISPERLYKRTGSQTIRFNTLYQLLASREARHLDNATTCLLMPDLFAYWLSGVIGAERTIASTTQMVDPMTGQWAGDVLAAVGLRRELLPDIEPAGSVRGQLLGRHRDALGLREAPAVIATASHDTAAAFAAADVQPGQVVVSCGTWALVGVVRREPLVTEEARLANFSNELGANGTVRFLKNVTGLWLVQECRAAWAAEGEDVDYATLTELAAAEPEGGPVINPDAEDLLLPGRMPERIADACRATGQAVPTTKGAIIRCCLDSLAVKVAEVARDIARVTGEPVTSVKIIGGGARNRLLPRLLERAAGVPVVLGPVEATAYGNALVQLQALGERPSAEGALLHG